MNISALLHAATVDQLDLDRHATVQPEATVGDTIAAMNEKDAACALVVDGEELVGIYTDRDVLAVAGGEIPCEWPVYEVMARGPHVLAPDASTLDALQLMNHHRIRNLPVVAEGSPIGNVSNFAIVEFVDNLINDEESLSEHELSAQHGMLFIDFTGLQTSKPFSGQLDWSVEAAVRQMRGRGFGSLIVVDDRGALTGILTERDIQRHVCDHEDLSAVLVEDWMTPSPVSLSMREPIANALTVMAKHGFNHVPLRSETDRPVGIVSFRDLAEYLESSVFALG